MDINDEIDMQDLKYKVKELQEKNEELQVELNITKEQLILSGVSNRFDSKYTPPFRVGRKQGKAVLDANGIDVVFFSNSEEQARKYCDYLNGC